MAGERILVVDDEEEILELVRYNLEKEGFVVACTPSGEEALAEVQRHPPDLIVLDLMLPGVDGFEVCRGLKGEALTAAIPVLMLSARGEEADVVAGLELGADDYVTKPFSPGILIARIRNVLRRRRHAAASPTIIRVRQLELDVARHLARVKGKAVELTATEFALLAYLAARPGRVFTRGQLIDAVKGGNYPVTERSIDVQVAALRKKLGALGREIETVHGVGYRFREGR